VTSRLGFVFAVLVCCLMIFAAVRPAYAYIDPNAAGLVSQIVTPLLLFAAAGVTFFRKRIADIFGGMSRRVAPKADAEESQQE